MLLLDEPTNHLDIESIQWLEDFLISNGKAVIVISHDRKFVDNITTRTIEVTMGRIYDYKVNYSKYLELRKERREQQQKAYDDQQKGEQHDAGAQCSNHGMPRILERSRESVKSKSGGCLNPEGKAVIFPPLCGAGPQCVQKLRRGHQ